MEYGNRKKQKVFQCFRIEGLFLTVILSVFPAGQFCYLQFEYTGILRQRVLVFREFSGNVMGQDMLQRSPLLFLPL